MTTHGHIADVSRRQCFRQGVFTRPRPLADPLGFDAFGQRLVVGETLYHFLLELGEFAALLPQQFGDIARAKAVEIVAADVALAGSSGLSALMRSNRLGRTTSSWVISRAGRSRPQMTQGKRTGRTRFGRAGVLCTAVSPLPGAPFAAFAVAGTSGCSAIADFLLQIAPRADILHAAVQLTMKNRPHPLG